MHWDARMTLRDTPWPAGTPCWIDINVPDVAASARYYTDLLGWKARDLGDDDGGFVIATKRAAAAAAIGPSMGPGPVSWTLYFASDDVDKTAAAILENGGTILLESGDVGPAGRMCFATEPSGAMFGVWQAGDHIGAGIIGEPGALSWTDLRSTDPDLSRDFFSAVFGFEYQPMEMAGPDYSTFTVPGSDQPSGGIGGMMGNDGVASHWLVYLGVDNVDDAAATTQANGGNVLAPPFASPYGRMAAVTDADGAAFWLVEMPPPAA